MRPRTAGLASLLLSRTRIGAGGAIALASLVLYLAAAAIVILRVHSIIGDAWSRVANAYYVLFSRDPHLAAIGFVWNPLPSLAVMPLLPFKYLWPDMVATGFAGSIISALCMAGAVRVVYAIAIDWDVRRSAAIAVTVLFAVNPMILYYGANGMSEAMFILTMLLSVRYIARWSRDRGVGSLVLAGVAMAAAYMTRYEAVVAAIASFVAVVIISASGGSGALKERIQEGLADAVVYITPFAAVFGGWAVASWLIVGNPFEQFTSVYGVVSQLNVAQSSVAQYTGQGTSAAYLWSARQLLGLEPGVVVACLLGLAVTLKGRHGLTIPAVAVLGSVVVWAVFGFVTGKTLGWLRYSISEIPLVTVLALGVLAPRPAPAGVSKVQLKGSRHRIAIPRLRFPLGPRHPVRRATAMAAGGLMVLSVAVAVPVGLATMLNPNVNPLYGGEYWQLQPVVFPNAPAEQYTPTGQYEVGRQAATYLDALHLGNGKVLVDGAMGFPIILESTNPTQFITTPDRDFQEALLDPVAFGVDYLLVPEAVGYQSLDALNRAYPGIYDHGSYVAPTLVAQFGAGGNNWRLYRVSS